MTEAQEKARYTKTLNIMKEMEKELEVLASTIKEIEKTTSSVALQVAKFEGKSQIIEKEVELESVFHGRTTTRELARRALVQSTAEANWKSLEEHPTILNIYQSIKDRRNEQEQRIEQILNRFESALTTSEMVACIKDTPIIREINNELSNLWNRVEGNTTSQSNDRSHANKQDLKIRDKIADIQTAMDALEFIQSETILTMDSALMFEIGAWARSGYSAVADGLREILKKPKEEPKEDGKVQDTLQKSEG